MYEHVNVLVKVINIFPVKKTVDTSNNSLAICKTTVVDKTGNIPLNFMEISAQLQKKGKFTI